MQAQSVDSYTIRPKDDNDPYKSAKEGETWCPCISCSIETYHKKVTRPTLRSHTGLRQSELFALEEGGEIDLYRGYLAAHPGFPARSEVSFSHYQEYIKSHPEVVRINEESPQSHVLNTLKRARAESNVVAS